MGILDSLATATLGAASGAGKIADLNIAAQIEQDKQMALEEARHGNAMQLADKQSSLRNAEADAAVVRANKPENVQAAIATQVSTLEGTRGARIADKAAFGELDTQQKVDEFKALEPLQRQSAIDAAVGKLQALATPENLALGRKLAQSTHIIDPNYTLIPNSDGTVTSFDSHGTGKGGSLLLGSDGKPIVRKDPEELKAASSVINMATTNLRIAEASYKADISSAIDEPTRARATATWTEAQQEARRQSAPALAILYGKAGIPQNAAPAPAGERPPLASFQSGAKPAQAAAVEAPSSGIIGTPAAPTVQSLQAKVSDLDEKLTRQGVRADVRAEWQTQRQKAISQRDALISGKPAPDARPLWEQTPSQPYAAGK